MLDGSSFLREKAVSARPQVGPQESTYGVRERLKSESENSKQVKDEKQYHAGKRNIWKNAQYLYYNNLYWKILYNLFMAYFVENFSASIPKLDAG